MRRKGSRQGGNKKASTTKKRGNKNRNKPQETAIVQKTPTATTKESAQPLVRTLLSSHLDVISYKSSIILQPTLTSTCLNTPMSPISRPPSGCLRLFTSNLKAAEGAASPFLQATIHRCTVADILLLRGTLLYLESAFLSHHPDMAHLMMCF